MTVHIDVIKEESYTIEIDVPEDKEDELYNELSCEPCMEDIFDVMCFLEKKEYLLKNIVMIWEAAELKHGDK